MAPEGDPGSGKTTLLRHLARTLADAGGEPWVPVFESLPRLLREERWLFDRIEQDLGRAGHPGAEIRQALEHRAEDGRLVLLLNGLDEVPRELRAAAEELLGDLAQKWPRSPIVVATRPIGASSLGPEYCELEVLPFDNERRRTCRPSTKRVVSKTPGSPPAPPAGPPSRPPRRGTTPCVQARDTEPVACQR